MAQKIYFRWDKRSRYSIAALLPLVEAELTCKPRPGIMLYSFATPQADEVYREVAASNVNAIFIAGGPHPSAIPEQTLKYFDYVVIGEGEETLPELISVLQEGGDPGRIKGIAYRRDGQAVIVGRRAPVNLDCYPPFQRPILAPVEISRGCPWRCAYCQTPRLFGHQMHHRSIPIIVKYARFHKDIRFTSSNSLAYGSDGRAPRLEKVEALLRALAALSKPIYFGTFPSEVRPEFVSNEALEMIAKFCSNRVLNIGGQSGSTRVLEAIWRGHNPEDVEIACELCCDHGLTPVVDLIFGLPMETEEDQLETLNLARAIIRGGGQIRAHHFLPLPGTPLAIAAPAPISLQVAAELGKLALEGKVSGSWMARGRTA